MEYRLLIIGNIHDRHIHRFIKNLKMENSMVNIDVLSILTEPYCPINLKKDVGNCYFLPVSKNWYSRVPIIKTVNIILSLISLVKSISNQRYDIINIHFPMFYYRFIMKFLKTMTKTILVTPWGSDVYRVNGIKKQLCQKIYSDATYICGTGNRFSKDVAQIYDIPQNKFVNLDIGSETIDYITTYRNIITPHEAKLQLGLQDRYIITCGYNGSKAQNHMAIIDAIHSVHHDLPRNVVLLFPMTYGGDTEYITMLVDKLDRLSLSYRIFTEYLPLETLFLLRQATDIFIHIQTSDANSATVHEYLLCNKKVINGSWLRYNELEIEGKPPYFITEDVSNLGRDIVQAYNAEILELPGSTENYIMNYGWRRWIVKWNRFFQNQCEKI